MTEQDIDKACRSAGIAAADAVGEVCANVPDHLQHIVLAAAGAKLRQIGAETIPRAEIGRELDGNDWRLARYVRQLGQSFAHYPDQAAMGRAATEARDKFIASLRD